MRGRPRPQDRAEPRPETRVPPPVPWARTPRGKGGRMAPGAAGEAGDGSEVSPGTSGDRGLSCLRAGPGTGGKDRARGHGWGWQCPRKAVEQGRCTPSLPHCTPQAAPCVSLPPPRSTSGTHRASPALSVPPGVPCWVVLTNPVQVAGEHNEKCPNADC